MADEAEGKIKVEREPTPEKEAAQFNSGDEARESRKNNHELAILDRNLGKIGIITGSTNASLNVATVIIAGLLLILAGCILLDKPHSPHFTERLVAAILTVAGFIFGVHQGRSN